MKQIKYSDGWKQTRVWSFQELRSGLKLDPHPSVQDLLFWTFVDIVIKSELF